MLGHYCEVGSDNGTACPPGTFLNITGGRNLADCLSCSLGSYCPGYGNVDNSALCDAGFYCPGSMNISTPAEYICPQG